MKAWTTATAPGTCAYDGTHHWKEGERVFAVQGKTWRKLYCPACAKAKHGAPEDTGELLDIESAPQYPEKLKPSYEFTGVTRDLAFDAKEAALPPSDRADYDDRTDDEIRTGSGNGASATVRDADGTANGQTPDTEGPPSADEASRALREEVGF